MALALALACGASAQDRTLRVNYTFSGNSKESHIYLDDLNVIDGWAGRRVNMKDLYLEGNGQITMTDEATGDTLYRNAFSTLFQEWQNTEEATKVDRSFENVYLLPMPTAKAVVEVKLTDNYNKVVRWLQPCVTRLTLRISLSARSARIRPSGNTCIRAAVRSSALTW